MKNEGTDYNNEHLNGGRAGISRGSFCPTNSESASVDESGRIVYKWNENGPVYFNNQLELDPTNLNCALNVDPGDIILAPDLETLEFGGPEVI